jgi:hypothetical protein
MCERPPGLRDRLEDPPPSHLPCPAPPFWIGVMLGMGLAKQLGIGSV